MAEVARTFEVKPNVLHRWRREFRQRPGNVFPGFGNKRRDDTQQAKLERMIGQQILEIEFLKGCLQRIEEQRMLQASTGKPSSTGTSKSKSGGKRA
ncbi:MAG: transposase [Bryobacteraceae bacterium]